MSTDLQILGPRLVGRWTSEATHPAFPGTVISGSNQFEWLDGDRFLIYRTHYDHPDFPDAISVIGETAGLLMHYFDSRGVHRLFEVSVAGDTWSLVMDRQSDAHAYASSDAPFSQRMTYTFGDGDQTMAVLVQLAYDDVNWADDLEATYRRAL